VKSNSKQPSCKKVCSPEEGHCEKSKVAAKNAFDGKLISKILIAGEFVIPSQHFTRIWHQIHLNYHR